MATDEKGRWFAESDEPFNAGLRGTDPELIRRAVEDGPTRGLLAVLWFLALACAFLAVFGASVFFAIVAVALLAWAITSTVRRPREPRPRRSGDL